MSRYGAIIFDKDGTLFDFQATWGGAALALLDAVAPGGMRGRVALALGVDPVTGRFEEDSVMIAGTTGDVVATLVAATGLGAEELQVIADRVGTEAPLAPAVPLRPCLTALSAGRVLGLVTNDTEVPARSHLQAAGIADLFAFVAGYDSGFGRKPGPGQLLAFARATGIAPEATLMVGDSRHDLAAGRAAGMATAGVLTGIAKADELADLADVILPDIGHLEGWLAGREA